MTNDNNAPSFKYKANLIGNTENNGTKNGVKIAVPLKYLSNFWRSLEIPLINCKIELSLKWIENCVLTSAAIGANANATGADSATFKITDAKLYVPIVTLSAEDNVKLSKLLGEGFKRSIYWNGYKVIDNKVVKIATNNEEKYITELLDSSWQGVKRLFVLVYNNKEGDNEVSVDSFKKYFLPRFKITILKLMVEIFMVSQLMTQLNNMMKSEKISTGQGDDYSIGCLLDFAYFEKNADSLQLI